MILLIDNYDSFAYNLYQLIGGINPDIKVIRNDELTIPEIEALKPEKIIISPGPGRPSDAGIIEEVIKCFGGKVPMLGVCLGHQAIVEAYGGDVDYAKNVMHGKASVIKVDNTKSIFKGLKDSVRVARYHSLVGKRDTIPECLEVIATSDDNEVMAIKHRDYCLYGLQFHPESILTDNGEMMMRNFLEEKIDD